MRVENKQSVNSTDTGQSRPATDRTAIRPQADKVSLDGVKHVEAVVQAVQANVGVDRNSRLRDLETAIRQGGYRPDAGMLADKIVQAAEVDARLRAIFGG